jgi:hypothetical protein
VGAGGGGRAGLKEEEDEDVDGLAVVVAAPMGVLWDPGRVFGILEVNLPGCREVRAVPEPNTGVENNSAQNIGLGLEEDGGNPVGTLGTGMGAACVLGCAGCGCVRLSSVTGTEGGCCTGVRLVV